MKAYLATQVILWAIAMVVFIAARRAQDKGAFRDYAGPEPRGDMIFTSIIAAVLLLEAAWPAWLLLR